MTTFFRLGAMACAAAMMASTAIAGQITVESGKTKPIRLKQDAGSVVIGNQNVADVAVHSKNMVFISGKTFGTTNLLIFDVDGNTILSADVVVTTNAANLVTVNRAGANFTYNCAPACKSSISIGDDTEYFDNTVGQIESQKALNE